MKHVRTFESFLNEHKEHYKLTPKYWDESIEEQFLDYLETIENVETGEKGIKNDELFWGGPPMSVRREMAIRKQERGIETEPSTPTFQTDNRSLYLIIKGYFEKSGLL